MLSVLFVPQSFVFTCYLLRGFDMKPEKLAFPRNVTPQKKEGSAGSVCTRSTFIHFLDEWMDMHSCGPNELRAAVDHNQE